MSNLLNKITATMNNPSATKKFKQYVSESREPLTKEFLNEYEKFSESISNYKSKKKI